MDSLYCYRESVGTPKTERADSRSVRTAHSSGHQQLWDILRLLQSQECHISKLQRCLEIKQASGDVQLDARSWNSLRCDWHVHQHLPQCSLALTLLYCVYFCQPRIPQTRPSESWPVSALQESQTALVLRYASTNKNLLPLLLKLLLLLQLFKNYN